jgi:hypothetical protein
LHKWFITVAAVLEDRDRISARKLALLLDINRNTASDMIKRINDVKADLLLTQIAGGK